MVVSIGKNANILQNLVAQALDIKIVANVFDQFQNEVSLVQALNVVSRPFTYKLMVGKFGISIRRTQKGRRSVHCCH